MRRRVARVKTTLVLLLAGLAPGQGAGVGPETYQAEFFGAAVRGDLSEAGEALALAAARDPGARSLAGAFESRFVTRDEVFPAVSDAAFTRSVVDAYRRYWTVSLMKQKGVAGAEADLHADLRRILENHGAAAALMTDAETRATVSAELDRLEQPHQLGRTPPYLDLLLWNDESRRDYTVTLTDGSQPVTVVFMSDFSVMGWIDFASLGHASAGGWATETALYCLADQYDLGSEAFTVSYLKHEARHFADYALFPGLPPADLEYRAKLTELVYAERTLTELLSQFEATATPTRSAPHPYAAWRILEAFPAELSEAAARDASGKTVDWTRVDPRLVRREARRQLDAHTRALIRGGPAQYSRGALAGP